MNAGLQLSRSSAAGANRCLRVTCRQLRTRQTNGSFRSLRPDESTSFRQESRRNRRHRTREPSRCRHGVSKNEDVAGERLLVEHGLHLRTPDRRSRDAYRSRRLPARSWSRYEVQSLAQALKDRAAAHGISTALDTDHRLSRKLRMSDRAGGNGASAHQLASCVSASTSSHACNPEAKLCTRPWTQPTRRARMHVAT